MNKEEAQQSHPPIIFLDIDGVGFESNHTCDTYSAGRWFGGTFSTLGRDHWGKHCTKHLLEALSRVYFLLHLSNYGIPEERILGSTTGFNRSTSMNKGRKASDDQEYNKYSSRAEEIRAWLREYQLQMGNTSKTSDGDQENTAAEHQHLLRFVILDDRPTAADDTDRVHAEPFHSLRFYTRYNRRRCRLSDTNPTRWMNEWMNDNRSEIDWFIPVVSQGHQSKQEGLTN